MRKVVVRLGVLLFFAGALRVLGLHFGLPYLYNPDEPYAFNAALRMALTGDLNPHWFGHPGSFNMIVLATLFLILCPLIYACLVLCGMQLSWVDFTNGVLTGKADWFIEGVRPAFYWSGRLITVLFAVTTIVFLYRIGKKAFGETEGRLAALFLAISPLHIAHSRYMRPDIAAALWITASIYFLLKYEEKPGSGRWLVFSALCVGFATAAKYTSVVAALPVFWVCRKSRPKKIFEVGAWMAFSFFFFAPFVFFNFPKALHDMKIEASQHILGHARLPGLGNHGWYLKAVCVEGFGGCIPALLALGGLVDAFIHHRGNRMILLFFPVSFFFLIGAGPLRFERWMIPVLPFEALFAGVGTAALLRYAASRNNAIQKAGSAIILFIVAGAVCLSSAAGVLRGIKLSRTDTRTLAKDWIEKNLPPGTLIAYERFCPPLEVRPKTDLRLLRTSWEGIVGHPLEFYMREGVNYLVLSSYVQDAYRTEISKYPLENSRYTAITEQATLLQTFKNTRNPGPRIDIYQIK